MNGYADILIVGVIVLIAAAYLGRMAYRRISGRERACGSCGPRETGEKKAVLTIGGKPRP